ncbi:sulfite exporter TauE/SafE family protein [Phyllobacterium sp. 628]|uniref:sulfite exporter TauE/SafE family protein n=1 Tax=Phyllobacterium sp. 628 TaxID=2718938 RepID=UPI003530459C
MGLPTVAMGILGAIMPPAGAAALLLVPSFVTNNWQLFAGPSFAALAFRFWTMMLAILAGTVAGSWLMANDAAGWTTIGLGAALVTYAVLGLLAPQLSIPNRLEGALSPVIGLITGVITGGTGVFVIPAVPYLQSLGLSKDDLIQALGLSFTVSTIALAIGMTSSGTLHLDSIGTSTLALAPALLGMWFGQKIRNAISPATFRRWFLICLLLLGLELMLRPFL